MRFWKRLMFPPQHSTFHADRLSLKGDLPWEPWIHCGIWLSMFAILAFGESDVVPPVDDFDWVWLIGGLLSPPVGFASVWMLAYCSGKFRYVAMWLRMLADAGVVMTIFLYQMERFQNHGWESVGFGHGIMGNVLLDFSAWYMSVLVGRDIRLIIEAEKLAAAIYYNVRGLTAKELIERMDDAN